jgi:hypothetical protein
LLHCGVGRGSESCWPGVMAGSDTESATIPMGIVHTSSDGVSGVRMTCAQNYYSAVSRSSWAAAAGGDSTAGSVAPR